MAEAEVKKWKPVHQLCLEQLSSEVFISAEDLLHWAKIYADGAFAPPEAIPQLIRAILTAETEVNNRADLWEVNSVVQLAISNLRAQLEESEQKKKQ